MLISCWVINTNMDSYSDYFEVSYVVNLMSCGSGNCDLIIQAHILGILAEHSLPFSVALVLINMGKELDKEPKSLGSLTMDRTIAIHVKSPGVAGRLPEIYKISRSPAQENKSPGFLRLRI